MAAPADSARQGTNITTAATSHAINVGSPVAGTLLVVFVRFAGAPGTVTFTGYTSLNGAGGDTSDASDDATMVFVRKADGAEGATDTLTTVNSVKLAAMAYEITGAEDPTVNAPAISTVAVGTTAANSANPNSVAPVGAPQDTLYLALAAGDGEVGAYTAAPTNYVNLATANSGTGGNAPTNCFLGTASRQITASSSDDPGAFTHGAHNAGWTAYALAIRASQPASINAAPGSYSVSTATPAGTVAGRAVEAASGSYAMSGVAATVPAARAVNAALGAYAVSGPALTAIADRLLNAAAGTHTLSGLDAGLPHGFTLDLAPGSYGLTGVQAGVLASRMVDAAPAAFVVSGSVATLNPAFLIAASVGTYALTGPDATLLEEGAAVSTSASLAAGSKENSEWI